VYNLLVSHMFEDWDRESFQFSKSRFLEYTSEDIREQLRPLSTEAIECIRSWPCVIMEEGRGEEQVYIARILEFRDSGADIALKIDVCTTKAPILNDHLWRARNALDIEQFEFSRNHWAIKECDLFAGLHSGGHEIDPSIVTMFKERPLPAPRRAALIDARKSISEWSHTEIDDFLLEAGVKKLSAGRQVGGRRDRANAIVEFALENPTVTTAENSLFSAYIVRLATLTGGEVEEVDNQLLTPEVGTADSRTPEAESSDRSPNRVFVVHGQNDAARTAVVSFLESIGLIGIVLHEQPNMGRHLLTKFIQEADLVTFAVVLMTDDDVGGRSEEKLKPRARQNVILELGYFLAHLGQAKVCALITPGLEPPSDFDGIVYIRMDDEQQWQRELRRELLAAKMPLIEESGGASVG
jgi:predicted nucleotide-binding protein